jgi:hypothetical protein
LAGEGTRNSDLTAGQALDGGAGCAECAPEPLFGLLRETLVEVLGPATTATLLRRSAKYAEARQPTLAELEVTREGFEYRYALPPAWRESSEDGCAALRELVGELWRLLLPLTGTVVVARLERVDALRRCQVVPPKESG